MPGLDPAAEFVAPASAFPPVVSSAHLAAGGSPGLSELEYGLILASHAFTRWMSRCMTAAGRSGLSALEILILHTVCHRDRPKKLADICLVLDVEDTHLASYAIRKLSTAGLVTSGRLGKEKVVEITEAGGGAVPPLCRGFARRCWSSRCVPPARWRRSCPMPLRSCAPSPAITNRPLARPRHCEVGSRDQRGDRESQ